MRKLKITWKTPPRPSLSAEEARREVERLRREIGYLKEKPLMRACSAAMPEILAPAGNQQALEAAVRAGADAVYLGLTDFNAPPYGGQF